MSSGQQVLIELRKMIISGEIAGGSRLAEIPTAEMLGVSRQPIRMAFRLLEQEGLLVKNPTRGYTVREISSKLVHDALHVRGVLEGLAAKTLAEKGMTLDQHQTLLNCITQIDSIFNKPELTSDDLETYHHYNTIFHNTIIQGSDNVAIVQALSKNNQLPMASAQALTYDKNNALSEIRRLQYAHIQHCSIFNALKQQDSARAESLMREHSHVVTLGETMRSIFHTDGSI
ncbi:MULTISPECIES: GntR family transcriptional regulator [unclassified Acinetobacter]|uniref:GntR family transcriptional regulator n=1 Tax=unclassified Acinetobacter TaxID=196816 RepID=UPI0004517048|nr:MULTISPECIES: GntR family transcriptional regulator [unclassified Acinetobacter]EZQ01635.1 GntR family transcriptional regulator [Acinetobacter sp. Ver3]SEL78845.1 transcriptional regulator, GntR family [Acinetobacter sp. DSM 11652]